jgi:hypothetical protein
MITALIISITLVISGCSPPQTKTKPQLPETRKETPTPFTVTEAITTYGPLCNVELSYILFPDGTELYLGPETEIEFLVFADPSSETPSYEVLLRRGHLIILSQPPQDVQFTVFSPEGFIAQLAGSLMYVGFDEDTGFFKAICVDGVCDLGSNLESLAQLTVASEGRLNESGELQGPYEIDINLLSEGCSEDFISVVKPPTPTPDLDATATAFCGEFEVENPGTPCP